MPRAKERQRIENSGITKREWLALICVAGGMTNEQGAQSLGITYDAFRGRLVNISYRWGTDGQASTLVREGEKRGYLE